MSAPRLPYAVTLAVHRPRNIGLDIATFEYAELTTATQFFDACRDDPDTIAVTLEGPDGETLADFPADALTPNLES